MNIKIIKPKKIITKGGGDLLISEYVTVKWNSKNRKYYIDKGYVFTKFGDEIQVRVEDLSSSSKSIVQVQCDFCHEIIVEKAYQIYVKQHHPKYGDCCKICQPLKNKLCCMDKYGVDNGSKTDAAISKIKDTFMNKYGVDNISKLDSVKEIIREKSIQNADNSIKKMQDTMMEKYGAKNAMHVKEFVDKQKAVIEEKYGVPHPKQSREILAKERMHNLEKYGVEYVLQVPEFREKSKKTCLEKYGYEYSLSSPEVRAKRVQTLFANGDVLTSKQQLELRDKLLLLYGNCVLNEPCGANSLDCVVRVNGVKIDVEYDGRYWHQDKQKDRRRDEFVKSQGYKILRFESDRLIPTDEQIKDCISELVNTDKKFIRINLV